ncbi:MAG: hypothetical protein EOL87_18900 [Spartobacteria bacterium]|nr:hypothetical protein [Spartobacteria bacterium]
MSEIIELYNDNRPKQVRSSLARISERVIKDFCELSELLYEVWEGQYHKTYGYASFTDYVEAELDIKGRKAYSLVQIAKTIKRLGIPWEDVREVGWRKMGTLSPVLTQDNYMDLVEEAKETSLPKLSEKVKATKEGKETPDDPRVKLSLQFDEDENSIVMAAIEYAKRYEDIKNNNQAIAHICYHWLQHGEK